MESNQERRLLRYGDRELWYAEADDRAWRLPLYVEWHHDKENDQHFARVLPAVCLYHSQALTLTSMLQVHDIQGRRDQWILTRRIAEAILHKAPGITPAAYYLWAGDDAPPIEQKPRIETTLHGSNRPGAVNKTRTPSFVEWLSKETKISSSIINAVLTAVANGAPEWLVEHRNPLDLGFCRISALPFRANWKEIVAFKGRAHNLKLGALFKLPHDKLWDALEDAGLPEILTSPHNVGLRRGWQNEDEVARIDYTLEAIPSEKFESEVNRIEGKRMARGPSAYVAEFEDAVEAVYQAAVSALRSYLKKVTMPFAQVFKGGMAGGICFMPIRGRKVAVRGTALSNLPVHVMARDSRFSVFGKQGDQFLIPETADEVPKVPNLLQETTDVRERDVDGKLQLIGESGTDRVPLPPSIENLAEREPVLAGPTDSGNGMDLEGDRDIVI